MGIVPVNLTNKSNQSRYKQGGNARLLNCYVEQIGDEGKVPWAIYSSDGLRSWSSLELADGGIRAALFAEGTLYVVAGTRFFSINPSSQIATYIGPLTGIEGTKPVYIERNRASSLELMIVCGGFGFYYRNNVLGKITDVDADLFSPQSLTFNNGYFVIGTSDNRYQAGTIDNVLSWDPLSFGRADANPDPIVRVDQYQGDIVIFGELTTQFARDVGTTPFPYQTVQSIDIGCFAANSVATVEQSLAFIASDRSVRILNGYDAQKISTHAVDRDIQNITNGNDITATSWVASGHTFYCISSSRWTWVYDTVTNTWHERKSYGSDCWDISTVIRVNDKLIAGSRTTGMLYEMSPNYKDENGTSLISQIILPPVHAFPNPLTFNAVYIDVQTGVGTGQGETQNINPNIMLEWSADGGDIYKGSRLLSLGQQGKNLTRVRAFRLGQSKEDGYTFRLTWSANVARALYGMSADVEKDAA